MSTPRKLLLGLFFLVTVSVLGFYTLFLTDFTLFHTPAEMSVRFAETHGLREGDSVLVAGMRWGKVKRLTYDKAAPNERRITVDVVLNEPLELREGFAIQIEEATLLGGRFVTIDPGPPSGAPVPEGRMLFGTVARNPLETLGSLVSESQKGLSQIIEDLAQITAGVREGKGPAGRLFADQAMADGMADGVRSAAKTLANLEQMSDDLAKGKGTAGQLLASNELYDELLVSTRKLGRAIDDTAGFVADVRAGKGLLPRLLNDETLANDFAETVAQVRSVAAKIDHGEGTIATLLNDGTVAKNLQTISQDIVDGKGSMGALLTKSDIYENLRDTSENLAAITDSVKSGQGSLGRLVMDDEIYQQIKTSMQIVQRALEEYREAAPVTTFTSVLFGAF